MPNWLKSTHVGEHTTAKHVVVNNVASRKTPAGSIPASPANLGLGAEGNLPPLTLLLYPGWLDLLEDYPASVILVVSFGFSFVGPFSTSGPSVPLFPLLGPAGPLGLYFKLPAVLVLLAIATIR